MPVSSDWPAYHGGKSLVSWEQSLAESSGEAGGGAMFTQVEITDSSHKASVGSADPSTLKLAE